MWQDGESPYVRCYDRALRYARRRFGLCDAEDLVQEAMLRLWQKRDHLDLTGQDPWPLLKVVIRNLAIDRHRQVVRVIAVEIADLDQLAGPTGDTPVEHVLASEASDHLRKSLETLSERDRELIYAHASGVTIAELAARYGETTNAVRQRLWRIRQLLRRKHPGWFGLLLPGWIVRLRRWPQLTVRTGLAGAIAISIPIALPAPCPSRQISLEEIQALAGQGRVTYISWFDFGDQPPAPAVVDMYQIVDATFGATQWLAPKVSGRDPGHRHNNPSAPERCARRTAAGAVSLGRSSVR